MKRFVSFFLCALVLLSCNKSKEDFKPIEIKIDLKDDVSPLVGAFSIPGNFDLVEWTFEDLYSPSEYSPNPAYHVFLNKGLTTVKVTAYRNEPREKFQATKEITIPDVAKKIKFTGLSFKNVQGENPLRSEERRVG